MRLGVDLDGVVFDLSTEVARWANSYNLSHSIDSLPFSNSDFPIYLKAVEAGILRDLPLIDGAIENLLSLYNANNEINITTARGSNAEAENYLEDTIYALKKHNIPYNNIYTGRLKYKFDMDLYIDDSVNMIKQLQDNNKAVIIFDTYYNKNIEGIRAYSWDDIPRLIEEYF